MTFVNLKNILVLSVFSSGLLILNTVHGAQAIPAVQKGSFDKDFSDKTSEKINKINKEKEGLNVKYNEKKNKIEKKYKKRMAKLDAKMKEKMAKYDAKIAAVEKGNG